MNKIEIWAPKYCDNTVLIAKYKVENGYNEIEFTKAKHLLGKRFKVHSTDIKSSPIISNGKIQCYAVPFDKLIKI